MVVLQNGYQQLRLEKGLDVNGEQTIRAIAGYTSLDASLLHKDGQGNYQEKVLGEIPWEQENVIFAVKARGQEFTLSVEAEDGTETILADSVDGRFLGSETAGGFVGAYLGMFASGNGTEYDNYAAFDWFSYEPEE